MASARRSATKVLLCLALLAGCGGDRPQIVPIGFSDGGSAGDASTTPPDPAGPYGDCRNGAPGCAVTGSVCPQDSTGVVCAPPCGGDFDCPAIGGTTPQCLPLGGKLGTDTYCVIPCSNTVACPTGLGCVAISGVPSQCGWQK